MSWVLPVVVLVVVIGVALGLVLTLSGPPRGAGRRSRRELGSDTGGIALDERPGVRPTETVQPTSITEGAADVAAPGGSESSTVAVPDAPVETAVVRPPTFRDRLAKARAGFGGYLGSILSRSKVDQETWDDLEEALIRADVGIAHTGELLDAVRATVAAQKVDDPEIVLEVLKAEMKSRLSADTTLVIGDVRPSIWLFVGVNGVGKTTTIGKVGHRLTGEGHRVLMAAGDTFRAAAAEQLGTWADRCGAQLVRGAENADPSSVVFDAVAKAAASGADVVLADTAGRLHTKSNLMAELSKVRRVADKGAGHVDEVLLVIDATTGQNGLTQAAQFKEAAELTGVVLTKLDGSAKGGIVYAIARDLGLPIKLVGLGETAVDLVPFDADEFVDALVSL